MVTDSDCVQMEGYIMDTNRYHSPCNYGILCVFVDAWCSLFISIGLGEFNYLLLDLTDIDYCLQASASSALGNNKSH